MVQIILNNKEETDALKLIRDRVPFIKSDLGAVRYSLAKTTKILWAMESKEKEASQ